MENRNKDIKVIVISIVAAIMGILFFGWQTHINGFWVQLITYMSNGELWAIVEEILYKRSSELFMPLGIAIVSVFGYIFIFRNKLDSAKYTTPIMVGAAFMIGYAFMPFITIMVYMQVIISFVVTGMITLILDVPFRSFSYYGMQSVQYIIVDVLNLDIELNAMKESTKLFINTIVYFIILPYTFKGCVSVIGVVTKKLSRASDGLMYLFSGWLCKIPIDVFRYITYLLAFFLYMMCYIWGVEAGDAYTIKEGLLTFIIIDVVTYGIYCYWREKHLKNKQLLINEECRQQSLVLLKIRNELEAINCILISNNMDWEVSCKGKIKLSYSEEDMRELNEKYIKDDNIVHELCYLINNMLRYSEIRERVIKVQACIDEKIVR